MRSELSAGGLERLAPLKSPKLSWYQPKPHRFWELIFFYSGIHAVDAQSTIQNHLS